MESLACAECPRHAGWVKRTGVAWRCPGCAAVLYPPAAEQPQKVRQVDALRELDNLARWLPHIDGSAIPLVAPIFIEDEHASGTTGRARLEDVDQAITAQSTASSHCGRSPDSGRPDNVDEHSADFGRAVDTLRVLDLMSDGPSIHVLVLLYVGLWLGGEARQYWWTATEDRVCFGEPAEGELNDDWTLGLDWRVGMVFASAAERYAWLYSPSPQLGHGLARVRGAQLMKAAMQAYEQAAQRAREGAQAVGGRVSLGAARDAIARVVRATDEAIAEVLKPRAVERRKKARAAAKRRALTDAQPTGCSTLEVDEEAIPLEPTAP